MQGGGDPTTEMQRPTFRFAPSPNGYLHLGHAASALINRELAHRFNGRFLLRIEDIDIGRSKPAFDAAIREDLAWLGLSWEEPVLRQSEHLADYQAAAAKLAAMGLLYPCFASRKEIAEAAEKASIGIGPDGARLYPGLHRELPADEIAARQAAGEPFVMRLDMEKAAETARQRCGGAITYREMDSEGEVQRFELFPSRWGDVVLQRKDVPTSYHLSVVVDDARQGITHVVRGLDLQPATAIHRVLQILLEFPEPIYFHHALVCDPVGRKLSKSEGATSLNSLRASGWTPAEVKEALGLAGASGKPAEGSSHKS